MRSQSVTRRLLTFFTAIDGPDIRGQRKGTNESILLGSGMCHRAGSMPGEPPTGAREFTLSIKGQGDQQFWGEIASKDDTGLFLGMAASDRTPFTE